MLQLRGYESIFGEIHVIDCVEVVVSKNMMSQVKITCSAVDSGGVCKRRGRKNRLTTRLESEWSSFSCRLLDKMAGDGWSMINYSCTVHDNHDGLLQNVWPNEQ
jgi:hypothetical protein